MRLAARAAGWTNVHPPFWGAFEGAQSATKHSDSRVHLVSDIEAHLVSDIQATLCSSLPRDDRCTTTLGR